MAAIEVGGKTLYTTVEEKLAAEGKTITPFIDEENEAIADHIYDARMEYLPEVRRKAGQSRLDIENGPVLLEVV